MAEIKSLGDISKVKSLEIERLLPAHHQLNISVGIIGRIEKAFSELSDKGMLQVKKLIVGEKAHGI